MKKLSPLLLGLTLTLGSVQLAFSQEKNVRPVSLSIPAEQKLSLTSNQRKAPVYMDLPLPDAKKLRAKVNINKTDETGTRKVIGQLENQEDATLYLRLKGASVEGHVILKKSKTAYHYFTQENQTFVEEVDIDKVLCVDYAAIKSNAAFVPSNVLLSTATLKLQSAPGAKGCIYLDFDGEYVTESVWTPSGFPINAQPSGFNDAQVRQAYDVVREDFLPFNMNVTTDSNVFNSYPVNYRIKVIFTPTTTAAPGTGGVAHAWSFRETNDPCWVFNLDPIVGGETASHEVGHTLGLMHDGSHPNPTAPMGLGYYPGQGEWGPIMGAPFGKHVTQWSKGDYRNANMPEDDIAIIGGFRNGVGFRNDDHGNTMGTATPLKATASGVVMAEHNSGIIEKNSDLDYFSFSHPGGPIYLNVQPTARHANLNLAGTLYSSTGTQISYSNMTGLTAAFQSGGPAGTYYLSVGSVGSGFPQHNGYSNYGSVGAYTISGNISGSGADLNAVTFYTGCNYSGTASFPQYVGYLTSYDFLDAGIVSDDVSSLKVSAGYAAILYENDYFTGPSITITSDDNCLTDNGFDNKVSSIRIIRTGNQVPLVELTAPLNNASIYTPANIVLYANAFDTDGTISKVEFYNGASKIGERTGTPYNLTWNNVAVGNYSIRAVATDNSGAQTTSNIVTISVSSYPAAATFYPNANYFGTAVSLAPGVYDLAALQAKGISDNDIESVMVVNGFEVILFKNNPANGEAKRIASNTTNLTSGGFDNSVSSLVVRPVTANIPPIVEMDIPYDSTTVANPLFQFVNAVAMDVDGHIARIEFYDGATLLASVNYPNTSFGWYNVPAGTHVLTAKAYDNENAVTVSTPITVFVPATCSTPAWSSSTAYVNGNLVEQGGIRYRANWWTINQSPATNNGPTGSGQPWTSQGACTSRTDETAVIDQETTANTENLADVYPNPFQGNATLKLSQHLDAPVSIRVYDAAGTMILRSNDHKAGELVNLGDGLKRGLYLVHVQAGEATQVVRIMKGE